MFNFRTTPRSRDWTGHVSPKPATSSYCEVDAQYSEEETTADFSSGDESYYTWDAFWNRNEHLLHYRVPKTVIVKSKYLGLPNLFLQAGIIGYIVIVQMMWQLRFISHSAISAKPLVHIEQPSHNFFSCNDLDLDCVDTFRPVIEYPYCHASRLPAGFSDCRYYDAHEVQPLKYEGASFVATSFAELYQHRCDADLVSDPYQWGNNCTKLWATNKLQRNFVAGVEDFQLLIRHSFTSHNTDGVYSGMEAQGFLQDSDGSRSILACIDGRCSYTTGAWNSTRHCGSTEPGANACFSSTRGDVISVGRLLKAAGISLDDSLGLASFRQNGVCLLLHVTYENVNSQDFWQWPVGRKMKYIYTVSILNFGETSRFKLTKWRHLTANENDRVLYTAYGVLFVILQDGQLGNFDAAAFIVTLAGAMALLRLADTFVSKFLVQCYRLHGKFHYVYYTFAYYTRDFTPRARDVLKFWREHEDDVNKIEEKMNSMSAQTKREYWQEKGAKLRERQEQFENLSAFASCGLFVIALLGMLGYGNDDSL